MQNSFEKKIFELSKYEQAGVFRKIYETDQILVYNILNQTYIAFDLNYLKENDSYLMGLMINSGGLRELVNDNNYIYIYYDSLPKETLKKAESIGLIDDEQWLDMLNDRNELTHDYDFDVATEKCDKIINDYIPLLKNLKDKVEI